MSHLAAAPEPSVTVRAPGKINLSLRVGPLRQDGYHPLVTIFQAVSLVEEVTATEVPAGAGISIRVGGLHAAEVPTDRGNLAWRAAELVAARAGIEPDVALTIAKGVPVAGGMAGGSADAAATLVACDALWGTGLDRGELDELAAELGSDVAFALLGFTAVGTGRGQLLTPAMVRGEFAWAFAVQGHGLSTGAVYRRFDELSGTAPTGPVPTGPAPTGPVPSGPALTGPVPSGPVLTDPVPADDTELMQALRAGNPEDVGALLHNALQEPALTLAPHLRATMEVAREAGALGVTVSGSGPTVAALGRSRRHALAIAAAWTASGTADEVLTAVGPVAGARIV